MRRALPWLVAALVVALDRVTKVAVLSSVAQGEAIHVLPGLSLTHVHNTGIAFSLFADGGPLTRVLIHLMIVGAVVVIAWMLVRQEQHSLGSAVGFGLILGGAIGNLADRILFGWVLDFVHVWVRIGERIYSWPDFNVADSSITVGAILIILHELFVQRSRPAEEEDAPHTD